MSKAKYGIIFGLLAVGLSSCGPSNRQAEGGAGNGKVSFMLVDTSGNPLGGEGAGKIIERMNEWTGVDVDFTFVPTDQYDGKFSEALKSPKTLPMMMHVRKS